MATEFISNSWLMPTNANAEANRVSNYSLDFDGTDQYIDISNFDLSINNSISIWFNRPSTGTHTLLGSGSGGSWNNYTVQLQSTGKIRFANENINYVEFDNATTQSIINTTNTWINIIIIRSESNVDLYVNGTNYDGTKTFSSGTTVSTVINTIGAAGGSSGGEKIFEFTGNLTEVSIFDYSLTASQVTELYGTGSAIGNPMAITNGRKPVAYYPLGNSAFNGEFLVPNGAEKDYVFDFLAAPTYSRISLGTSDFIGNKSISFWLNKNANNGSVFAFGNTNYYPNVQSTTLQLKNGSTTVLSTGTINLNEWNHYVITGDGTTAKCYVNGVYKSSGIDRDISSAANWIGGQNNGTGMLNGKLSNIQKWDVVLSDGGVSIGDVAGGDISTLYNYGTPYKGTQPQSANLQAWWELDASATFDGSNWSIPDASSNSNTGTSSGMTAANLVQSDLIINAPFDSFSLNFDGTNDSINVPNSTDFDYGTGDFTWSFWLNVDTHVNYAGLFYFASFGSPYRLKIQSDSTIFLDADTNDVQIADLGTGLAGSGWHSLIFVRNSGTIITYLDGSQVDSVSYSHALNSGGNPLIIANNGGSYLNGKLSNISIYNSALTSAQVTTLYNNRKPFDLNTFAVTPVSWWRLGAVNTFYNSTTTEFTVLDEVGTNDGTSVNMEQGDLVDGVGATGSGLSSGMGSGENRKGTAPFSENNAVSYNLSVLAKSTSTPT